MVFQRTLVVLLVMLPSVVTGTGQGGKTAAITKTQLRQKIQSFKDDADIYVRDVKDIADDVLATPYEQLGSEEKVSLEGDISKAFLEGTRIYTNAMAYSETTIGLLWNELLYHTEGAVDGFVDNDLKCSALVDYVDSRKGIGPVDSETAWGLMGEDWRCLAHQFQGIFVLCDKLSQRREEVGVTIEDAVEGLGLLTLRLMRLRDTGLHFYLSVYEVFQRLIPNELLPDDSSDNYKRTLAQQLLQDLKRRESSPPQNDRNPPPPPPPNDGNPPPPPPPPPPSSDDKRNTLLRALEKAFNVRDSTGGNPPPPPPPPPNDGNPPPPPPPPSSDDKRNTLLRALEKAFNVRDSTGGNPPPPPPPSDGNPPPPPPPPSSDDKRRALLRALRRILGN